jgi:MFS superfamily sulfate permease-like transporter
LNLAAGARSRWASIFSGVWMLLILVVFSGVAGKIPIPTLAAVLIFAAAGSLRLGRVDTVLRTGLPSQIAFVAMLAATLFLPVTAAVGIGVGLSLLLQVNQEAVDLTVVRLERGPDRRLVESAAPATVPSREVTLLDVYGSLLFAGARTPQTRLPDPAGSEQPVVVLRLRGRTKLGATAFIVLADYAERLQSAGGHLFPQRRTAGSSRAAAEHSPSRPHESRDRVPRHGHDPGVNPEGVRRRRGVARGHREIGSPGVPTGVLERAANRAFCATVLSSRAPGVRLP